MFSASVPSNAVSARGGSPASYSADGLSHLQPRPSDASASGKGGHPRDAGRKFGKLPRHVAWGEVAKANQARRLRC